MKVWQYEFVWVCDIKPEREKDDSVRESMPQSRYNNKKNQPLHKYGNGPFCKFTIPKDYKVSCVYAIVVAKRLKYIGECVNLSSRFNMGYGNISPRNCFKDGQQTNCRINNLIFKTAKAGNCISLYFLKIDGRKSVESNICKKVGPDWNRV